MCHWTWVTILIAVSFTDNESDHPAASVEEIPPPAADRLLTLAELEQLAIRGNPHLVAQAARADVARGEQVQAGLYPNPRLAYDASDIGSNDTAGQHGFFLQQEFVTAGKLRWRQATAGYQVLQRQCEAEAELQRIRTEVRQRYYEILVLQQRQEQDERVVELYEELEEKTRALQDSDKANEADLLLVREAVRRRRLELSASRSRYLAAWQELAAYLGQPDLPPTRLRDSLEQSPIGRLDPERLLARGLESSPEIQAARAEVGRARAALARWQAEAVPNVTVRAGAYYDFANQEPVGSLRVYVPLPIHDRNQGNRMAAEAEIREACAELERIHRELRQRLVQLLDRYRRNAAIVEEYSQAVLPDARRAYEIYLKRFAEEESSYSSAESALENYVDRLREYLESLHALRQAEAELCRVIVRDDED